MAHTCKCGQPINDYVDEVTIRDDNGVNQTHKTDPQRMRDLGYDLCINCRNKAVDKVMDDIANEFGIDRNSWEL